MNEKPSFLDFNKDRRIVPPMENKVGGTYAETRAEIEARKRAEEEARRQLQYQEEMARQAELAAQQARMNQPKKNTGLVAVAVLMGVLALVGLGVAGYLFLNKLTALSPETDVVYANSRLKSEVENVIQYLDSDKDLFKKSIEYFSNGKFSKAKACINKLCEKYPKFLNFRGIAEIYTVEEHNDKAVEKYYEKTLKALKKGQIYQAKNYIDDYY